MYIEATYFCSMSYQSDALTLTDLGAEIDLLDPDLPVAVVLTDLDDFVRLNEAHGRQTGDAVLSGFERALAAGLGPAGRVAHVRGDEFAAMLPDTAIEEALLTLDRIRAEVAGSEPAPGLTERITTSVGIAGRPAHGATAEELVAAAEAALVRAKRAGGNRVCLYVEERMVLKSSYYPRAALHRLAKLARQRGKPEATLLREALDDYLAGHQP
jgi:diguanylate cyclase